MAQRKTTRRATKAGTFGWTTLFLGIVIGFILASLMYFWFYYHTSPIKGKAPGLQLPKPAQTEQVQVPTPPPAVPAPVASEPIKPVESASKPDQIGQLIQQEANKTTKPAQTHQKATMPKSSLSEDTLGNYLNSHQPAYLQVGVFQSTQQADSLRARLLLLGYTDVQIKPETLQDKAVSKVWVGPFKTPEALKEAQKTLRSKGIKSKVVH